MVLYCKRIYFFMSEQFSREIPAVEREELKQSGNMREFNLESPPDRDGTKGVIRFEVDWRPTAVHFSYDPVPLEENLWYELDDHKRAFNKQLANGGRDMRVFSLEKGNPELRDAREERMKELDAEIREVSKRLQELLEPARIMVDSDTEITHHKDFDEDKGWRHRKTIATVFRWQDLGQKEHKEIFATRVLGDKEVAIAKRDEGDVAALEYLRKRMIELEEVEESAEVKELQSTLESLQDELAVYEGTYFINIPVYLYDQLSPEEVETEITKRSKNARGGNVNPKRQPDFLSDYGSKGTRAWYEAQKIDLNADKVVFPFKNSFRHLPNNMIATAVEERLAQRKKEQAKKEKARASEMAKKQAEERAKQDAIERAQREAEMTPEVKVQINNAFKEVEAFGKILATLPQQSAEREKFAKSIPLGVLNNIRTDIDQATKGKLILEDIEKFRISLEQLADRKKINEEVKGLKKRAEERLNEWKGITEQVKNFDEAQMIIADEIITEEELIAKVQETYLTDPWNSSVETVLHNVVEEIVEAY